MTFSTLGLGFAVISVGANFHFLLTVEMFLLGADHLLRGGLTDGLGEALAGDTVPRGQQPVVDRLSRHTVPLSQSSGSRSQQQLTFAAKIAYPPSIILRLDLINLITLGYTSETNDERIAQLRLLQGNGDDEFLEEFPRETVARNEVKLAVLDAMRTDGRERDYGSSGALRVNFTSCTTPRHDHDHDTTRHDTIRYDTTEP